MKTYQGWRNKTRKIYEEWFDDTPEDCYWQIDALLAVIVVGLLVSSWVMP